MVHKLTRGEVRARLRGISGWTVRKDEFSGTPSLHKEFKFKDFSEAMRFARNVGKVAEDYEHHPDIHLIRYNHVVITIYTHLVNGVTAWDFQLARLIDKVKIRRKRQ